MKDKINIKYRKSIKKDISEINNLFIELVNTVNERMIRNGIKPYTGMENGFENGYLNNFYINDSKVIYVATDDEKVVGFISIINYENDGYIYIDDYCVNDNYRGLGIGTKLMDLAFQYARSKKIDEVRTHVVTTNYESIQFYKNYGFNRVEEDGIRLLIKKDSNLSLEKQNEIIEKNNLIVEKVLNEIKNTCPDSIDMVAIAGSFCSKQFYEKSDCDLFIVANNENVENISKCFILNDIGQDIYVSYWKNLRDMSNYTDHFVTKLKDLNIIYTRTPDVLDLYKLLQVRLNKNMNNDKLINKNIGKYLGIAIEEYKNMNQINDLNEFYIKLGLIMNNFEKIIYMINKKYVVGGTKSIPFEIMNMDILPDNFLDNYNSLFETNDKEKIIDYLNKIVDSLVIYFKKNNIDIINPEKIQEKPSKKQEISRDVLIGTYEELFSNYYNKLHYATRIKNKYLSLRTMIDAQDFFDYFSNNYLINKFNLAGKYNPDNLEQNAIEFDNCLSKWKELYNSYGIKIEKYDSIDELYSDKKENNVIKQ